jgi:uncharacterized protein YdcH (DUF465 family)
MEKPSSIRSVTLQELRSRHRELELRLADLDKHLSLTPAEQVERSRLKKEKLWIKDRLLAMDVAAAPAR